MSEVDACRKTISKLIDARTCFELTRTHKVDLEDQLSRATASDLLVSSDTFELLQPPSFSSKQIRKMTEAIRPTNYNLNSGSCRILDALCQYYDVTPSNVVRV
jgi:hypothetical protein